ncbi:hypothetical protein LIA77_03799 [Sarocladium implicatum]|nr:hypothetical protein LIA77_03799 [Sarocladium implicatum]
MVSLSDFWVPCRINGRSHHVVLKSFLLPACELTFKLNLKHEIPKHRRCSGMKELHVSRRRFPFQVSNATSDEIRLVRRISRDVTIPRRHRHHFPPSLSGFRFWQAVGPGLLAEEPEAEPSLLEGQNI